MDENEKKGLYEYRHQLGGVCLFILFIWLANASLLPTLVDEPGTFGDMFGGINALFSGLAFVGVIAAILLQSKELELQRKELAETREVLKDQKQQLELQNQTIKKQQFENTFFELLRLRSNIAEKITLNDESTLESGLGEYTLKTKVASIIEKKHGELTFPQNEIDPFQGKHGERYQSTFFKQRHVHRHIVLSILEFTDRSDFNRIDKDFYAGLLRGQLSKSELHFLAHCYIYNEHLENIKLLTKYGVFKNMPKSTQITNEVLSVLCKDNP